MSDRQTQEERNLILAAQKNPAHFAPLYQANHERIFRFIYNRVDSADEAADLTSQVFIKALSNLNRYKPTGAPFKAWLFRIAVNEVNMFYRQARKQRTISVDQAELKGLGEEFGNEGSQGDERQEVLIRLLQEAEEADILLLEMRYFEKMSFRDIGTILGITENNAKVKTYRVLDKLKKKLEEWQK